jgi:DNA primase
MTAAPHTEGRHIDRDEVLARTNLDDVLDAVTTSNGQTHRRLWHCPEPSHPDEHPSVTVTTDAHGVQRWRCWSGGHGGTAIDAVIAARGLSFGEAIRWLNDHHAHLEPLTRRVRPAGREVGDPSDEVLDYVHRCEKLLWTASGRTIRDWLNRRGLSDDVLAINRVGADPGRRYLPRPKGFPAGFPAVVYPALDPNGAVTYFQARYLNPPSGRGKYDNPGRSWAANPRIGFTHPATRLADGALVITEGIADALAAAELGYRAAGLLGAGVLDARTVQLIRTFTASDKPCPTIVVCMDADPAGHQAAAATIERLRAAGCRAVRRVDPPESLDLTDWIRTDPAAVTQTLGHLTQHHPTMPPAPLRPYARLSTGR